MAEVTRCAVAFVFGLTVCACGSNPASSPTAPRVPGATPMLTVPAWAHVAPEQVAEARKYGVPVAFENGLGMRFVLIPAGTFMMGSPQDEDGRDDNEAQHEVMIAKPYYMSIYEVTNGQYRRWRPEHDSDGPDDAIALDGERQPVVFVKCCDAAAFAEWVTSMEGRRTYRLPSEPEWECACRAGSRTLYSWGDSKRWGHLYENLDDAASIAMGLDYGTEGWPEDDGYRYTAPVGSYAPSRWGLYDMHGNVKEWCGNWYEPEHPAGTPTITGGPAGEARCALRGASFWEGPSSARSAAREWRSASLALYVWVGFRLCSPLPEEGE